MDNSMDKSSVTGVILAGGEARRMGGQDKGLVNVNTRPLIEYVIDGMKPQVSTLIINANNNHDTYRRYNYPVIADLQEGFNGPLAGMYSCMEHIDTEFMVTAPCDSPFFPPDLVYKLLRELRCDDADISVAHDGERIQPVFLLMKCKLNESLKEYLDQGDRKVALWLDKHKVAMTDFSDNQETFININTPEDIDQVENKLVTI